MVGETITSTCSKAFSKSRVMSVRTFWARAVVRVVVAGAERVRAEHDAALDLGAEAGLAGERGDLLGGAACRRRRPAGRSAWPSKRARLEEHSDGAIR